MDTTSFVGEARSAFFEKIGRGALYALALLLPLWVLPITASPVLINKAFFAYAAILIAFIAWLIIRMQVGSIEFPKNFLALALVLFAGAVLISGIFSESRSLSFESAFGDPSNALSLGFFVLAAFLA